MTPIALIPRSMHTLKHDPFSRVSVHKLYVLIGTVVQSLPIGMTVLCLCNACAPTNNGFPLSVLFTVKCVSTIAYASTVQLFAVTEI
jgi:hypothetical protein